MTNWLFTRGAIVVGVVVLVFAIVLAIALRDGPLGNITSIVGLAVSILGFVVTIWTVMEARQQIAEASKQAQKAIAAAKEETRRAVEGIASQLLAADCAVLRNGVEDLRQAAQDEKWARAVYRCLDYHVVAIRLSHDQRIGEEDAANVREAADDFLVLRRFIEKNRLAGQTGTLQNQQFQQLDDVIGLLARIQGRLHHRSLQVTDRASEN